MSHAVYTIHYENCLHNKFMFVKLFYNFSLHSSIIFAQTISRVIASTTFDWQSMQLPHSAFLAVSLGICSPFGDVADQHHLSFCPYWCHHKQRDEQNPSCKVMNTGYEKS